MLHLKGLSSQNSEWWQNPGHVPDFIYLWVFAHRLWQSWRVAQGGEERPGPRPVHSVSSDVRAGEPQPSSRPQDSPIRTAGE